MLDLIGLASVEDGLPHVGSLSIDKHHGLGGRMSMCVAVSIPRTPLTEHRCNLSCFEVREGKRTRKSCSQLSLATRPATVCGLLRNGNTLQLHGLQPRNWTPKGAGGSSPLALLLGLRRVLPLTLQLEWNSSPQLRTPLVVGCFEHAEEVPPPAGVVYSICGSPPQIVPHTRLECHSDYSPPYRSPEWSRKSPYFPRAFPRVLVRSTREPNGVGTMHQFSEVANPEVPGGTPTTGQAIAASGNQVYRQNLSSLFPKAEGEPLLLPFDLNGLVAGNAITFECESGIPEFWNVGIRPVANSKVSCYNGPEASGVPYRIGGGGKLKVRAKSEFFTVVAEAGSAAIVGSVVATRKMEFEIDGGAI